MTEENTPEEASKPKRKIRWITIFFVTVGVAALGAALIIPQYNTYCCGGRAYDSDAKSNLHNVFLACKAYWYDNGSDAVCTSTLTQSTVYGYIQSADVNISVNGAETAFSATARNINSDKTFSIDSNGTITEVD